MQPVEEKVFITKKGKKYHTAYCTRVLGKEPTEIPLEMAIKKKYEPCLICVKNQEKNKNPSNKNTQNIEHNSSNIPNNNNFNSCNENNKKEKNSFDIEVNSDCINANKNDKIIDGSIENQKNDFSIESNKTFPKKNNEISLSLIDSNISSIPPNDSSNHEIMAIENNENEKQQISQNIEKIQKNIEIDNNKIKNEFEKNNRNSFENYCNNSKEKQNEPFNKINNNTFNTPKLNKTDFIDKKKNKKLNWKINDIKLLSETNSSAKLIYLNKNIVELNNSNNMSENENMSSTFSTRIVANKNHIHENNENYKFFFDVNPINEKNAIKISVGFEIDLVDESDINVVNDDGEFINDGIKLGSISETIVIMRNLIIYNNSKKIHVLINLTKGKFFIVGENELEKKITKKYLDRDNYEIMYLRNFNKIIANQIRSVRPIFKYNKEDLKYANIELNGLKII